MTKLVSDRKVTVRLSDEQDISQHGAYNWLLADYPNEFEAQEGAKRALQNGQGKFAHIIVTTIIAA